MRSLALALICAALFAAGAGVAAKTKKPPRGHLGSEWVGADGNMRLAQVGFNLVPPQNPAIYRMAEFDWRKSSLQIGPYPPKALKAGAEGIVTLNLAISADGKATECSVTGSSGHGDLDAHACAHILRYALFVPALNNEGKRVGVVQEANLSYLLSLYVQTVATSIVENAAPRHSARPVDPVSWESLGILQADRAATDAYGIGASVTVNADGKPTRCWLSSPSLVDALDFRFCDQLMNKVNYIAARNATGQTVEDRINIFLTLR